MTKEAFVYEAVKDNLIGRITSGDIIVAKSWDLLKINLTFITAELGGIMAALASKNWWLISLLIVLIGLGYYCCAILYCNIKTRTLHLPGNIIKNLCAEPYSSITTEDLILAEALNYDERINLAMDFNACASKRLNTAISISITAPIIGVIFTGVIHLLAYCVHL